MRLFKFVKSRNAVLNIAQGSLKFTPIKELNDPSELTPVMDPSAVQTSLADLRKAEMTQAQFVLLQRRGILLDLLSPETKLLPTPKTLKEVNCVLRSDGYNDLDYLQRHLFSTINNLRSRVGILSLSRRYESLPMWVHYADSAKGFVVVLDNLEQSFKDHETGTLNTTKRVQYVKHFIGMTFDPSTQDQLFFSKLRDWQYEREWRVVTTLSDCQLSPDGKHHLLSVNPLHLAGVICGWRVGENQVPSLGNELKQRNPNAKLIRASLKEGVVTLDPPLPKLAGGSRAFRTSRLYTATPRSWR